MEIGEAVHSISQVRRKIQRYNPCRVYFAFKGNNVAYKTVFKVATFELWILLCSVNKLFCWKEELCLY